MNRNDELLNLWPAFKQSPAYSAVADHGDANVKTVMTHLANQMGQLTSQPLAQFRQEDLQAVLNLLVAYIVAAERAITVDLGRLGYQVIRAVFNFLVQSKRVAITEGTFKRLITDFEAEDGPLAQALAVAAEHQTQLLAINTDASLPAWKKATADRLGRETRQWVVDYQESDQWGKRPGLVDVKWFNGLAQYVVTRGYQWYRQTPRQWTQQTVFAMVNEDIPQQMRWSLAQLAQVVPTLTAWFDFVGATGLLASSKVAQLRR